MRPLDPFSPAFVASTMLLAGRFAGDSIGEVESQRGPEGKAYLRQLLVDEAMCRAEAVPLRILLAIRLLLNRRNP